MLKSPRLINHGERFDYVITVCDESNANVAPHFQGKRSACTGASPTQAFAGTEEEKLAAIALLGMRSILKPNIGARHEIDCLLCI